LRAAILASASQKAACMRTFALALAVFAGGCLTTQYSGDPNMGTGADGGSGGFGSEHDGGGGGPVGNNGPTSSITSNQSWSGLVNIMQNTSIEAGATVDVAAGTLINVATGAAITVKGTLTVNGTDGSHVIFNPMQQGASWGGVVVASGGSLQLNYADLNYTQTPLSSNAGAASVNVSHAQFLHYTGMGSQIASNATFDHLRVEFGSGEGFAVNGAAGTLVTVTDSVIHQTGGDALIVNGAGDFTFQYNHVYGNGGNTTQLSGQHCACHFSSTGTFTVDHNILEKSQVGFMAGGMNAQSKVMYNNFVSNPEAVYSGLGAISAGADLSHNFWDGSPPAISGNTTNQGTAGTAYYSTALPTYTAADPTSVGPRS
jgi:hypothetical protein